MSDCDLRDKRFGSKRWADQDMNIVDGCANNCRYCHAKAMAVHFKRIGRDEWQLPRVRTNRKKLKPRSNLLAKSVMFPSTHDITPEVLPECLEFIGELLNVYSKIIIVSKPHLVCIQAICEKYEAYKDRILFRFTIGSCDPETLRFWEPGAPELSERLSSLKLAHARGFETSVSCEPMLDEDMRPLIKMLRPFVTESIVMGRLNMQKEHQDAEGKLPPGVEERLLRLQAAHSGESLRSLYDDAYRIFHEPITP